MTASKHYISKLSTVALESSGRRTECALRDVPTQPQTDRREDQRRENRRADQRGGGRGEHVPGAGRQSRDREHERQLRRAHQRERDTVATIERAAVEQQGRGAADDEEEQEERQHLRDARDAREERVDVEAHPTG